MHNTTRQLHQEFLNSIQQLNGVEDASKKFNVSPEIETTMEERIQESSDFLQRINIVPVINQKGRKVGVGSNSSVAGRTDTSAGERGTVDPTGLDEFGYLCEQTNFDTHLTYAKLDAWRHQPNFQTLVRDAVLKQIGRDRIMIGWNGTSAAVTTDRAANPLLQDVNIGWLEKIRTEAPEHHNDDGVTIGDTGQYKNINALVFDVVNELVEPQHRDDTDLVAIMGRNIWAQHVGTMINDYNEPTEQRASEVLIANQKVGGLQAIRLPFFPEDAVLVTTLANLSVYWQEGTRRRHIEDNPKRDRVEDYQSLNEAYVVEDYDQVALVEGISFVEGGAPAGGLGADLA